MKIGVAHFGCASAGTVQIVRTLIERLSIQEKTVYGIEYNRVSKEIELKELTSKGFSSNLGLDGYVLSSFPNDIWNEKTSVLEDKLSNLDKVILLGGSEAKINQFLPKLLSVPISIFNSVEGSELTLGYDTALNSIVEYIESVRDTASSLSYGKVRVFNVQIPGNGLSKLLLNSALAVEAKVVTNTSQEEIEQLKQHIRMKEAKQESYTFLLMDQSVDPVKLGVHFGEFDLDWKIVEIDESQCGGPKPTALDRVIANQLKKAVVDWSLSDQPSGQLLIQDNQVLFRK
ncbi:6-phosphofructokinase [Metabacillus herbersteinensis]|uniref:6-phosphofructokinase n=1 Tax=Metabacillus herbersteinensis TaxID=283816 RepID=A0ABV6GEG0_9BACI